MFKTAFNIIVVLNVFFCKGDSVKQMLHHLDGEVSKTSIIQWFNYFRDVCTTSINNTRLRFDGQVYAVQCDETAIGGKCKYLHGRYLKEPRWLFGIVPKQDYKILLRFIPNKEKLTLCPIIYQHCERGSTINTDGCNSYRLLSDIGFTHEVIIHKNEFVMYDGVHMNSIENVWSNLKAHLKSVCGSQGNMLDEHIDEYQYRYNRKFEGEMYDLMVQDIANYYRV